MGDQDTSQSLRPEPVDAVFVLGLVSLVLVLITWAILGVMGASRVHQSNEYDGKITELKTKLTGLKDTESTYQALETVAKHAKQVRDTRYLFGPTWTMLKNAVPKDVQFTSLSLGSDATIRIVGTTKSVTSVAQFARELEKQTGVTMVTPLSIEKSPNSPNFGFSLSFKVATKEKS